MTLPTVVVVQKKSRQPAARAAKVSTSSATADSPAEKPPRPVSTPSSSSLAITQAVSAPPPQQPTPGSSPASLETPATSTTIQVDDIAAQAPTTSDTASLLSRAPGVSIYQGGGVSGLPSINGLADDRVKIMINGMAVTSACANHMNPPLSYADSSQIKRIDVMPGVTPVSLGGDSLAGTIVVETLTPQFATAAEGVVAHGSLSHAYRSNGGATSTGATATAATQAVGVSYAGARARSEDYTDGSGRTIGSTEYKSENHAFTLSARNDGDLYVIEGGFQKIPYQGFVNQPMDMTWNSGFHLTGRLDRQLDWGKLALKAFYQQTRHEMDYLDDKKRSFAAAGWGDNWTMPMRTRGSDMGVSARADIAVTADDALRVGGEAHRQRLDDRWPPVCSDPFCGMGPQTYYNINNGMRTRFGSFVEWERRWAPEWSTLVGVRSDIVRMNTGQVQPYERIDGDIDSDAADVFNGQKHARTDVNFDVTALARFTPQPGVLVEAGYARKSRSPNLYEVYAWGESSMTSQMVTWFGDSNGYIGNLELKPEVAHKFSLTLGLQGRAFDVRITPFYTYVQDYITAELSNDPGWVNGFNQLRFVNHDARLYGIDIAGRVKLGDTPELGALAMTGVMSFTRGSDRDTGGDLYHMMPVNGRLALEHRLGKWTNTAEVQAVDAKMRVDALRLEPTTPAYTLVNLRSSIDWEHLRLDWGVENLLDKLYFAPLGGTNYADYLMPGHSVAGMGRTVYTGVTVKF